MRHDTIFFFFILNSPQQSLGVKTCACFLEKCHELTKPDCDYKLYNYILFRIYQSLFAVQTIPLSYQRHVLRPDNLFVEERRAKLKSTILRTILQAQTQCLTCGGVPRRSILNLDCIYTVRR